MVTDTADVGTSAERGRRKAPSGPIRTPNSWNGQSFGVDWEQINRWDREIRVAAKEFGVPFERIKAHIVIESQGNPKAIQKNDRNGWSYGLMQVVPVGVGWAGWARDVLRLAGKTSGDAGQMMLDDPELAIRAGTHVLRVQFDIEKDWDRASSKFFLGNPNWNGEDHISGTTGNRYRTTLQGLIAEITEAMGGEGGGEGGGETVTTTGGTVTQPGGTVTQPGGTVTETGVQFGRVPHPPFTDRLIPDEFNTAWDNLGPRRGLGVVYHRQVGTNWGTDGWFRTMWQPNGQPGGGQLGLTDYGVDNTSGEILRWNDPTGEPHPGVSANRAGWASGPVKAPYGDGLAFLQDHGMDANVVNRDQASIEIAGQYDDPISDACKDAIAALSAYFADRLGIRHDQYPTVPGKSYSFVRWHQEFTIGTGKICPGQVVMDATDDIIARTKEILRRHQTGGS